MGKKIKYIIGNTAFETQAQLIARCSALLVKGVIDAEDDTFLRELLERHPERDLKVGCGVDHFHVAKTEFGSNGFYLVRTDGTSTDFSYKSCVKEPSHAAEVRQGLRNDATDFATRARDEAFRGREQVPCALTGTLVSSDEADVAYLPPNDFLSLIAGFLAHESTTYEAMEVEPSTDGVARWGLADRELARRWIAYLETHATPQISSSAANRRRPRK